MFDASSTQKKNESTICGLDQQSPDFSMPLSEAHIRVIVFRTQLILWSSNILFDFDSRCLCLLSSGRGC